MYRIYDKPSAVREVKRYLYAVRTYLYSDLPRTTVDTYYDDETKAAIKAYQRIVGLAETGLTDLETFTRLYDDYFIVTESNKRPDHIILEDSFPLNEGMQSEDVRILNTLINELGKRFDTLPNTTLRGDFYSKNTTLAVKTLESIFGMPSTGIVSKNFYTRLTEELKAHRRADQNYDVP